MFGVMNRDGYIHSKDNCRGNKDRLPTLFRGRVMKYCEFTKRASRSEICNKLSLIDNYILFVLNCFRQKVNSWSTILFQFQIMITDMHKHQPIDNSYVYHPILSLLKVYY